MKFQIQIYLSNVFIVLSREDYFYQINIEELLMT